MLSKRSGKISFSSIYYSEATGELVRVDSAVVPSFTKCVPGVRMGVGASVSYFELQLAAGDPETDFETDDRLGVGGGS